MDLKYFFKNESMKLVIEEDIVGFYLIVYKNPNSNKSDEDYLADSLQEAFIEAEEKFGVLREQWQQLS